nr:PREDICTED: uncharacterized protein LOC102345486 isoform X2 [Latimeria chalumnae]|eukprot:XP_014343611.1 PREDICTED: uncharacterized protein LOC102345486 isoform X2 [Latimeria chalumnae]
MFHIIPLFYHFVYEKHLPKGKGNEGTSEGIKNGNGKNATDEEVRKCLSDPCSEDVGSSANLTGICQDLKNLCNVELRGVVVVNDPGVNAFGQLHFSQSIRYEGTASSNFQNERFSPSQLQNESPSNSQNKRPSPLEIQNETLSPSNFQNEGSSFKLLENIRPVTSPTARGFEKSSPSSLKKEKTSSIGYETLSWSLDLQGTDGDKDRSGLKVCSTPTKSVGLDLLGTGMSKPAQAGAPMSPINTEPLEKMHLSRSHSSPSSISRESRNSKHEDGAGEASKDRGREISGPCRVNSPQVSLSDDSISMSMSFAETSSSNQEFEYLVKDVSAEGATKTSMSPWRKIMNVYNQMKRSGKRSPVPKLRRRRTPSQVLRGEGDPIELFVYRYIDQKPFLFCHFKASDTLGFLRSELKKLMDIQQEYRLWKKDLNTEIELLERFWSWNRRMRMGRGRGIKLEHSSFTTVVFSLRVAADWG